MKHIVITGVNNDPHSLGNIIAHNLHKWGNHLTGICHPDSYNNLLKRKFDELITLDLSQLENLRNRFELKHPVDILINCAGVNEMNWFEDVTIQELQHCMAVNCFAPIMLTQCLQLNLKKAKGTVCNIISMGAHKAFRTSLAYNISKAALKMANEQMARELNDDGITVFGVSPNELEGTGMTLSNAKSICKIRNWSETELAAARGKPQTSTLECARFISYLLEKKERHIMLNGVDLYYGD